MMDEGESQLHRSASGVMESQGRDWKVQENPGEVELKPRSSRLLQGDRGLTDKARRKPGISRGDRGARRPDWPKASPICKADSPGSTGDTTDLDPILISICSWSRWGNLHPLVPSSGLPAFLVDRARSSHRRTAIRADVSIKSTRPIISTTGPTQPDIRWPSTTLTK